MPPKQKTKIVKDVTQLVLARRTRMCNFLEYKGKFVLKFDLLQPFSRVIGRFEGCVSSVCLAILRMWHRVWRQ